MKYIVCEEPNKFTLKEKEIPIRENNQALIKVHRVGICGTDLHAYAGNQAFFTYPRILGHELAAEILEIEENAQNLKVGDKVIIMPYVSCGTCLACRQGKTNCCSNIRVLGVHADGGMQEQFAVRTDLLIPANHLSYEEMAIVEPLAIGAHAIRRANVLKGETIAVVGCGPIGIGLMKLAQIKGAEVIALDVDEARLEFVKNEIGLKHVVKVSETAVEEISKITQGDMATAVFDCTGNKRALEGGITYMSHGGRYVLVGLSKGELVFSHPAIHAKESTIMCSRNATLEDFDFVIQNLDKFPTKAFVTHQVHFTEMIENFDSWLDPKTKVIKAMVNFSI
ncbi:Putative L-galactonate oxidoreductase [Mariniflexile rhizosphaerae]|uniref:zinc-binding alcohol dehydrogenase family protein n=1 Tax=unclassified Mariniflexile TaxID=2643887 RepID=UPI000CAE4968|nr:zinc-binding alcohol dehydrogenase family protein [Mariniflexile sp. TRM1-10]AXP80032.1 Putative L-galactonate oxidoreductase [Mariniflexile sp. TRM1-10]PLB20962.1 MAG: L-threonine 3-dehydrogenase [Flavobacteriaceae bacterium FS1-H7996/R]